MKIIIYTKTTHFAIPQSNLNEGKARAVWKEMRGNTSLYFLCGKELLTKLTII